MLIYYLIICLCAGFAMAIQAAINSQLATSIGGQPIIATFISFLTGSLVLFVICWWKADLSLAWQALPKQSGWKFLGGTLGALAVFTTIFVTPKIGVTNMLFFIIMGQLMSACFIDHFGLIGMSKRPIELWQIAGLLLVVAGLVLFFFGNKLFSKEF